MSTRPSRSEIESALSSRRKKTSSTRPRRKQPDMEFSEAPRRSQVLGGDLSGVNQKQTFSIFSRYSDISVVNWFAGIVVLLIVVAFFWPQQDNQISEITKQIDSNKVVAVEDQVIEDAVAGTATFARESDAQRAQEFRADDAIDQRITQMLQKAAAHIRERRLTQPPGDNATHIYKQVLALRPNNADAQQGLGKIRQHFLVRGFDALDENNMSMAQSYQKRLSVVDIQSSEYAELSEGIQAYETSQTIRNLLSRAERAIAAGNFILPARGSALSLYEQVLDLDSENSSARKGVQSIADEFIKRAKASVADGKIQAAKAQIATVALIDPENSSIPVLEKIISNTKPATAIASTMTPAASSSTNSNTQKDPAPTPSLPTNQQPQPQTQTPVSPNDNAPVTQPSSTAKTPDRQANEQAQFDKQYLQQGLDAYYSGDYQKAAALLQPLADKGIARAQMRLAYMHFLGRGFPRRRETADQIVRASLPAIRKFANEGRGWAQSDLGSLYEDGLVLPRDYGEAVYWYRTAAEKGYPGAQTNLGIMYARGKGVASSRKTAIEWFQRAAQQGDIVAQRNLQAMGVN